MKNYDAAVLMPIRLARPLRRSGVLAAAVAAVLLVLPACGGDDAASSSSTTAKVRATTTLSTTSTTTSSTSTMPTASTTTVKGAAASTTVVGATTAPPAAVVDPVPDGTSFGYLTAVNVSGSTVTIDVAELLTGDAAVKAAIADGALEPGETSIDNDYYIRNKNPKLRTVPIVPSAVINVLDNSGSADLVAGSMKRLADDLAASPPGESGEVRLAVQIVAKAGMASRVDEVFFP